MQTGLNAQHVPYRGSAPMLQDLLAGNIQFTIDTVPGVMSFITSGPSRLWRLPGKSRSPALPDVPNNTEAGIPDVEMASWLVLLAPAGTPQPIVDRINSETNAAEEPELRDKILKLGAVPKGGRLRESPLFTRRDRSGSASSRRLASRSSEIIRGTMNQHVAPLPRDVSIAVIGAGTMGSGIALVAATAGHPVLLTTPRRRRGGGLQRQRADLERLVARGRLTAEECQDRLSRMQPLTASRAWQAPAW